MSHNCYYCFSQSPERRRQVGARGGRACAPNRHARLQTMPPSTPAATTSLPEETTAQAIAALEAQFPWLCGAEKRRRPRLR